MTNIFKSFKYIFLLIVFILIIIAAMYYTFSAFNKKENLCDWRYKIEFGECLKHNFPHGTKLSTILRFLKEEGFRKAIDDHDDTRLYYFRHSNSLSNYKAAVVIWHEHRIINRIEIR